MFACSQPPPEVQAAKVRAPSIVTGGAVVSAAAAQNIAALGQLRQRTSLGNSARRPQEVYGPTSPCETRRYGIDVLGTSMQDSRQDGQDGWQTIIATSTLEGNTHAAFREGLGSKSGLNHCYGELQSPRRAPSVDPVDRSALVGRSVGPKARMHAPASMLRAGAACTTWSLQLPIGGCSARGGDSGSSVVPGSPHRRTPSLQHRRCGSTDAGRVQRYPASFASAVSSPVVVQRSHSLTRIPSGSFANMAVGLHSSGEQHVANRAQVRQVTPRFTAASLTLPVGGSGPMQSPRVNSAATHRMAPATTCSADASSLRGVSIGGGVDSARGKDRGTVPLAGADVPNVIPSSPEPASGQFSRTTAALRGRWTVPATLRCASARGSRMTEQPLASQLDTVVARPEGRGSPRNNSGESHGRPSACLGSNALSSSSTGVPLHATTPRSRNYPGIHGAAIAGVTQSPAAVLPQDLRPQSAAARLPLQRVSARQQRPTQATITNAFATTQTVTMPAARAQAIPAFSVVPGSATSPPPALASSPQVAASAASSRQHLAAAAATAGLAAASLQHAPPPMASMLPSKAESSRQHLAAAAATAGLAAASLQQPPSPMTSRLPSNSACDVKSPPMPFSIPDATSAPYVKLEPDAVVQIGDHSFKVVSPIGEGTFGVVWGARCTISNTNVAIKEIYCRSHEAVADAVHEGKILHDLGSIGVGLGSGENDRVGLVPLLVACGAERAGPSEDCHQKSASSHARVRLAMTHIRGESLNRFLERRHAEAELVRTPPVRRFVEACRYARELVAQLAPAFARISTLAYHRDVNPRNILVEEVGSELRYGLIDFGLAVDATRWRLGAAQASAGEAVIGAWQVFGVGGDCRYWPVSAWLMLEQGPKALSARPQLCLEYKMHLDLHAFGISALQVLAELSPLPPEATTSEVTAFGEVDEALQRLWSVCTAWSRYWSDATRFWRRLFDAYRKSGDHCDLAAVKAEYRKMAVHELIGESLRELRVALRDACEACQSADPELGLEGAPPLFHALLAMISSGEDSARSSWRRVELLVNHGEHQKGFAGEQASCRDQRHRGTPRDEVHGIGVTSPAAAMTFGTGTSATSVVPGVANMRAYPSPAASRGCGDTSGGNRGGNRVSSPHSCEVMSTEVARTSAKMPAATHAFHPQERSTACGASVHRGLPASKISAGGLTTSTASTSSVSPGSPAPSTPLEADANGDLARN